MVNHKYMILMLLITSTLLCSCDSSTNSDEQIQISGSEESTAPVSESGLQSETVSTSQNATEAVSETSVEVGDGLYRISSVPRLEEVTLSCEYGTAERSAGATAQAFGQTLDFSSIPDEFNNDNLVYCVCDNASTVYFVDYTKFYRSDLELKTPKLLFTIWDEENTLPDLVNELISFSNTDLLFFRGHDENVNCVGSIDPETSKANYISCYDTMNSVPCNTGVMLYDYAANLNGRDSTVLYWECGEIYKIPLQNPKESENHVYISANGKYICTYLWGKSQDSSLVERYSVYDVKSGEFIKSFDWTFQKKVGDIVPTGFSVFGVDETTQSVYLLNTEDKEIYQFYFGG